MSAPWQEHVGTALRNLAAHRLRSVLTSLGIVIAVFSVVSVVSVTRSLELRILKDLRADQGRVFRLSAWTKEVQQGKAPLQPLDPLQVTALRNLVPELKILSPRVYLGALPLKHRGSIKTSDVRGIDENGLYLQNLEVACGREFTATDRALARPLVILGPTLAEGLGLGEKDLGRTITLGGQTAELVGILTKPSGPFGDMVGHVALVPFGSFKGVARAGAFNRPGWTLLMDDTLPVAAASERVRLALRRLRGLKASDPDNFTVRTNEEAVERVSKVTTVLMAAAGGMVGISLLVGGIGVMNIMLVTVTERTSEIGLRKSVGARRRDILLQFLIEASILCGLGGVLGLVLGAGLGDLVGRIWIKATAGIPVWAILSAFLFPVGTGLLFGLYPALLAARLSPIEALRHE